MRTAVDAKIKKYDNFFFFGVLLAVTFGAYRIMEPFFIPIALAALLATLFYDLHLYFLKKTNEKERLSAMLTSLSVLAIIIVPLVLISILVINEIANAYIFLNSSGDAFAKKIQSVLDWIVQQPILHIPPIEQGMGRDFFAQFSSRVGQWLLMLIQGTYQNVVGVLFSGIIMFFSFYFLLLEGKTIVKKLMYMSPLKDSYEKILIQKFVSINRATIKGSLVVGVVQGFIGGLTFFIAGVPSPMTWGVVMMFFSLIPMFGTGIVWFPAAVIMLAIGRYWEGIFIILAGLGIVSTIDNFLKPKLVGRDIQMHPLLVFFSTLGGLSFFGFIGFILGPIIMSLFLTLWDIYGEEFKIQLKRYNG